jgi:hypothetical protein
MFISSVRTHTTASVRITRCKFLVGVLITLTAFQAQHLSNIKNTGIAFLLVSE